MMIYVKVPWIDGSDADYYKFTSLQSAVDYILNESITEFMISSECMDIPKSDYTFDKED